MDYYPRKILSRSKLSKTNSFISDRDTNKSSIGQSGNSDVDVNVNVNIDTTSIAYAYLCSMLATKKMTNDEFETAIRKMEELTNRNSKRLEKNNEYNVKILDEFKQYKQKKQNKQNIRYNNNWGI
ncbi:hypothetical protein [Psychrobacillus lasiicapitis]|uniref:Uncharacterized protein n=1 Tax=Psychrobacillus lasiicapitis TaxID=1636719 RepID=A0A544SWE3_9BACI|nr:hypothetical protein [Psychrobacillus lasiicapitis]TQR09529.1 hypothetical protein FG382_19265 [Psychrobacillus lasiicapitis]GGA29744.1 hypothetical protein GCM10011384_19090 [Psychrobacillus lasiicapitis]